MNSNAALFPAIHATADFEDSAVVHAYNAGINPVEMDALAQVIGRLARDHSTVVPASMKKELQAFEQLGYLALANTTGATLTVELLCNGALLSSYFWSIWVPRHLHNCSLQVVVMSHLPYSEEAQHCSVVFRVPGSRDARRQFLHDLITRFSGEQAEIIAVQAGNALAPQEPAQHITGLQPNKPAATP
ncbi:hypothetical protein [Pseudomonas sp.]|uniref:hypothetical protein n=1 Tax=Pseudomonas sp. TaxID=306 RepID=UPI002634B8D9|nr:hypothetical protein [Pseudomonas sp.]